MLTDRINYLLRVYADDKATIDEVEELFALLREQDHHQEAQEILARMAVETKRDPGYDPGKWEPLIRQVLQSSETPVRSIKPRRWMYAAAAAVLLVISIGFLLKSAKKEDAGQLTNQQQSPSGIQPGHDGAILTLADNRQVLLDSTGNGVVATQGNTNVLVSDGRLVYSPSSTDEQVLYNTMTTPRGRQYQLELPDGTRVWLNAASSITYPTIFKEKERWVSIKGEAYFEVAKDKTKPFIVRTDNNTKVQVLGTHFNINTYNDEGVSTTTLLEGSVRVTRGNESLLMKPGQQTESGSALKLVSNPNLEQVMAWKNGLFDFNNKELKQVMAQLARWYDLDVKYEGPVPKRVFKGKITRDLDLAQVLKVLETVQVSFRLQGRTLIVRE